jgi:hypothetical protein
MKTKVLIFVTIGEENLVIPAEFDVNSKLGKAQEKAAITKMVEKYIDDRLDVTWHPLGDMPEPLPESTFTEEVKEHIRKGTTPF